MAYEYDCIRRQRDRRERIIGWVLVLGIGASGGVTLGALWMLVQ